MSNELKRLRKSLSEETGDHSYYKVVYGYQMDIVRTDWPTTDYGAITDILIDNLEKEGVGEPYLISIDQAENEYNEDEYVIGGNHGLALVHNGNFNITPIPEQDAKRYEKNDHVAIYTESKIKEDFKMFKAADIVNAILEGTEVSVALQQGVNNLNEEATPAYYEVVYDYYKPLIVKLDAPTTDYGAILDIVIDYLEDSGVKEPYLVDIDTAESDYNEDEYVIGGNHGLALVHNGLLNITKITPEKADQLKKDHNVVEITESAANESAGKLEYVKVINEPYGKGVEVKDTNGAIYRYAVDEHDPKYFTAEKVKNAVMGLAKRYNYEMSKIYSFLTANTLGDYDKDISNRTGLAKVEIVDEPNGNGLKVILDNGKVFRYTVDTNDEKYSTLGDLRDGAEGMWRHGASVDGIIDFLDKHALLYAREGCERRVMKRVLAKYVAENKNARVRLSWVK